MGVDKVILITLLNPFTQVPAAVVTETGEGPVTIKSLPFAAIELHCIFFLNTSSKDAGAQLTVVKLSMGVGCKGEITNGTLLPARIFLSQ